MRRLVLGVVLLGGCDRDLEPASESSSSESTGIDPSEGETFGEGESSTGVSGFADGEMFGFCEADEDCAGFDTDANQTTLCRANTCVEWFTGASAEGEPTLCTEVAAVAVVTLIIPNRYTTCGFRALVADGLGYCPEGMTLASWVDPDGSSTATCWWSDAVISGPTCQYEGDCAMCESQPYEAGGLPKVCV